MSDLTSEIQQFASSDQGKNLISQAEGLIGGAQSGGDSSSLVSSVESFASGAGGQAILGQLAGGGGSGVSGIAEGFAKQEVENEIKQMF